MWVESLQGQKVYFIVSQSQSSLRTSHTFLGFQNENFSHFLAIPTEHFTPNYLLHSNLPPFCPKLHRVSFVLNITGVAFWTNSIANFSHHRSSSAKFSTCTYHNTIESPPEPFPGGKQIQNKQFPIQRVNHTLSRSEWLGKLCIAHDTFSFMRRNSFLCAMEMKGNLQREVWFDRFDFLRK